MDLELGPDGWVYLAERDRILRIRDSDGDGKADVEENIAVLKTEADYPHNGLEGLAWHPHGDLIFGLGENYAKPWTLTRTDGGLGGVVEDLPRGYAHPFSTGRLSPGQDVRPRVKAAHPAAEFPPAAPARQQRANRRRRQASGEPGMLSLYSW